MKQEVRKQTISYYNAIAQEYDGMLEKKPFNNIIRKRVADKFREVVKPGNVLDLGGGTGLDLNWLCHNNYFVYFCEPSVAMKQIAFDHNKNILHYNNIAFLNEDETDLMSWNKHDSFTKKMDGVLCNFAVINCIPKIKMLFKQLAEIIKPSGHIIALVLYYDRKKLMGTGLNHFLKLFFLKRPISYKIKHNENEQRVFLYSITDIKKASGEYFDICSIEHMAKYGFSLIHLTRK